MKRILIAAMLVLVASLGATEAKSSVTVSCESRFHIKFNERTKNVRMFIPNKIELQNVRVIKFTDDVIKFSTHDKGEYHKRMTWTLDRIEGKLRTDYAKEFVLDCYKIKERKF